MTRKLVIVLGLILLLGGGLFWWRLTHPPLTDEQQIAANLEDIRQSLENGNAKRAVSYMAKDAKFKGLSRSKIQDQFALGYRFGGRTDVRITFLNTQTGVTGAAATTKGHYKVDMRTRYRPESTDGDFSLEWEKRDGEWIITDGDASGEMPN